MSESVGKDQYIRGTVSNEEERAFKPLMLMQPDGTLRVFALQVGQDANGDDRVFLVEDTRELAMSMHGEDPSGDIVGLRTDEQRMFRTRPYEPYRVPAVVNLGAAWATVHTVPAATTDIVTVYFGQTALGTTDYTAALRVNGLTIGIGFPVYVDAPPPVFGPFMLATGDIIEAYRYTGLLGAVGFNIERYSTGDQNTGV